MRLGRLTPEFEPYAFTYLDDIIVVGESFEEHMHWLEKVLEVIVKSGLTINREKNEFCANQLRYLGYLVDQQGCHVDPQKTEPIMN